MEPLDERVMAGFGGVAEYGITVRWDKNFLKLIRLLVERRSAFAMFGGVRFGGTLTLDDAWRMGFDHIALCVGAGGPTVLDIPNGLARGVRAASDFLMALQLTGAAKADSIANMQLRLPVVVIGGGLTAIDTATESLAYYVVQVEKFLHRYEALAQEIGEDAIRDAWDDDEREIAEEFLAHARAIRAGTQAGRGGRARAAHRRDAASLGRRHHRLPPPPGRQPLVHAEPRGGREGAGGRHLVRRGHDAGRRRRGPLRRGARHPPEERRHRHRALVCRRARCSWRPARSRTPCWRASTRRASRWTASISPPSTRTGNPVKPEHGAAKPATPQVLLSRAAGRPLHELFRRRASLVFRQRREGDGVGEAGLSRGLARAGAAYARERRDARELLRRAGRAAAARPCTRSNASRRPSSR